MVAVLAVSFRGLTRIRARAARWWPDDPRGRTASIGIRSDLWNHRVVRVAGRRPSWLAFMWAKEAGGADFSLSRWSPSVHAVLILGGFTSVPGAISAPHSWGGRETRRDYNWGPSSEGAIENWFAYVVALVFPAVSARKHSSARRSSSAYEGDGRRERRHLLVFAKDAGGRGRARVPFPAA